MDRRQLLTGMMATAFVAAVPFKAMAKLTTSASPVLKHEFPVKYDSISRTYLKEVMGRTEPLPPVVKNRNSIPVIVKGRDLVPPDPARAAFLLEQDRNYRLALATAEWDRVYTYKLP